MTYLKLTIYQYFGKAINPAILDCYSQKRMKARYYALKCILRLSINIIFFLYPIFSVLLKLVILFNPDEYIYSLKIKTPPHNRVE